MGRAKKTAKLNLLEKLLSIEGKYHITILH